MERRITVTGAQASKLRSILLVIVPLFGLSGVAHAVDGVRLITQARALAGNVTPGDAPGFPVTISRSGSYRLASNLSQTDTTNECASVNSPCVIEITSDNATLDLNGFNIEAIGGVGVGSRSDNVTVRNGSITLSAGSPARQLFATQISGSNAHLSDLSLTGCGFFGSCIIVSGSGCTVTNNRIISPALDDSFGISGGDNCLVTDNTITDFAVGISCRSNCTIARNSIEIRSGLGGVAGMVVRPGSNVFSNTVTDLGSGGTAAGIRTFPDGGSNGSMVRGNTVRNAVGFGLVLGPDVGYGDNVLTGNNAGEEIQVSGGIDLGGNLCGTDTTCP